MRIMAGAPHGDIQRKEPMMTSGGGMFSAEEVAYLKTLPAVADATVKRILYTLSLIHI